MCLLLGWVLLAACQPPAAPSTATVLPPSATASLLPPSATATEPATPTLPPPTASPLPPSATATEAPPTANFAPADIHGTWTRSDPQRGDLFLTLDAAGSYNAAHGTVDGSVHRGAYTLDGRLLTFVDGWNCTPEASTPGQYVLRLVGGGQWLYLDPYVDTCPDRPAALSGFRWDRYTAP